MPVRRFSPYFACLLLGLSLPLLCHAQTLVVSGDIAAPLTLTVDDLSQLPRATVLTKDQDGTSTSYEGVLVSDVLKKAGAPAGKELRGKALASYLIATAKDGYQVLFSLAELDPEFAAGPVIIADKRDGKPLFGYQGPLRIVTSDKVPARSIRMLEKLQVVRLNK